MTGFFADQSCSEGNGTALIISGRHDYQEETINKAISERTGTYKKGAENPSWENPSKIDFGEDLEIEFPLKALPEAPNSCVEEVSRVVQVDPALALLPGLGMAALQIGKKALVVEKAGLLHHPAACFSAV